MFDIAALNRDFDLISIANSDTKLRRNGRWYSGSCPFCGGTDRFVMKETLEGWRWYCRGCGGEKYHSSIDYIMRRENLSFQDAISQMNRDAPRPLRQQKIKPTITKQEIPQDTDTWRIRASSFVEECQAMLWNDTGENALGYLHSRGLKSETLQRYHIGYNPIDKFEPLEKWGIPDPGDGKRHAVWLPHGIVIPCLKSGEVYYVKIRRPLTQQEAKAGEQKYVKIKGSKPGIFSVDSLRGAWLAVFTEGEFDCMLLDQEAGDLVGVATLGSATDRLDRLDMANWGRYLLPITHILAAYDIDKEGEKGVASLQSFSDRVIYLPLPEMHDVKDITDLWNAGADLGEWIARSVDNLGLLKSNSPTSLAEYLIDQAENYCKSGDLPRFARLFATAAQMLGADIPTIPWPEWVASGSIGTDLATEGRET